MNLPRAEFLERRKSGIGGSDAAIILGLSPWATPVDLWLEKTGRAAPKDETLQMRFGSFAEEFVADEYMRETGRRLVRCNRLFRHLNGILIGNVDRMVVPEDQHFAVTPQGKVLTDRGWEGKTASVFALQSDHWGESGTDEVPPYYLIQVQAYQELTGCAYWDLSVLFGNQEERHYTIRRDAELGKEIAARASEWWNKHVVADVAPEPTCEADIKALFPRSTDKSIEATQEIADLVLESQRIGAQIAELEKQLKGDKKAGISGVQERIKLHMQDAAILNWMGQPIASYKSNKDSTVTDFEAVAKAVNAPAEIIAAHTSIKPGARPLRVTIK